jgi:dephospho-CoA kinase
MLKIGLTGGIGSGKSTVSELFKKFGIPVIDADIIARDIVQFGQPALTQLEQAFGEDILQSDRTLNRAKLRSMVFSDPQLKSTLEQILHPLIKAEILSQCNKLQAPYCVISIPLLLESNMTDMIDRILVVDCPLNMQISRVRQRDQLDDNLINRIIASQVSRETRLAKADDVIDNSKNANQLAEQVKKLHNLYLKEL